MQVNCTTIDFLKAKETTNQSEGIHVHRQYEEGRNLYESSSHLIHQKVKVPPSHQQLSMNEQYPRKPAFLIL